MTARLLAAESTSEIEVTETLIMGVRLVVALVGIAVSRLFTRGEDGALDPVLYPNDAS